MLDVKKLFTKILEAILAKNTVTLTAASSAVTISYQRCFQVGRIVFVECLAIVTYNGSSNMPVLVTNVPANGNQRLSHTAFAVSNYATSLLQFYNNTTNMKLTMRNSSNSNLPNGTTTELSVNAWYLA